MIAVLREWWGLIVLVVGGTGVGGATWIIRTRTAWFKSNTARVEEETRQRRMQASANAEAAIKRINEGDASAYGEMLEWMKDQLKEQSSQHQAVRDVLQRRLDALTADRDIDRERLAELEGRDAQCQRELGEMRVQITQQSLTHREEQGVLRRSNERMLREVKLLRKELFRLGGDPTKTIVDDE